MRKSRFTEEQIIAALKEHDAGASQEAREEDGGRKQNRRRMTKWVG